MSELFNKMLSDFQDSKIFVIAYILTGTICPGLLVIYIYNRSEFMSFDIFKLIFLSLAITSPIMIMNYIATMVSDVFKLYNDAYNQMVILFVIGMNCIIYYFNIIVSYFSKDKFKSFAIDTILCELVTIIIIVWRYFWREKPRRIERIINTAICLLAFVLMEIVSIIYLN